MLCCSNFNRFERRRSPLHDRLQNFVERERGLERERDRPVANVRQRAADEWQDPWMRSRSPGRNRNQQRWNQNRRSKSESSKSRSRSKSRSGSPSEKNSPASRYDPFFSEPFPIFFAQNFCGILFCLFRWLKARVKNCAVLVS